MNDFLAPLSSATGQHVTVTGSACQSLIRSTIGGWTGVGFRFASSRLSALESRVRPDSKKMSKPGKSMSHRLHVAG